MFEALVKTTMDPVNDISLAVAILKKKKGGGMSMLNLFASGMLWENSLRQLSSEIFNQFVKRKKKKDIIFSMWQRS